MRQRMLLVLVAFLIPAAFFAGRLATRPGGGAGTGDRKALYYVDPMNPAFRSPGPGTAPCGMPLEPVYDGGPVPGASGALPPGAVAVRSDRLQLIGVAREPVRSGTLRTALRLAGTVAPDETRLFRVTAATGGRIREMGAATTGSLVRKGEVLGAYYTSELLVPQQNFLRMFETYQKVQQGGTNPYDHFQGGGQLATYARNVDVARQSLMNLGMAAEQVEEVAATRQPAYLVQMRAPAAGVVTSRDVSLGQSFDAREELFSIADLGRVWVLADAFEGQEEFFKPGGRATVTQPGAGRTFTAVVSAVPPRFDAATRTLKVRLDVVNPGLLLRPDMLVDVELPIEVGPALFVPREAVLDSGTRRIVFVEQGEGVFVPRPVRTGRRIGEQVEIVGGLMEGEIVVTAGNFLLDSESRMRAAGAAAATAALDPICGMEVEEAKARAQGLASVQDGRTWFFCAPGCKQAFDRDPKAAAARAQGLTEPLTEQRRTATAPTRKAYHLEDPICGMDVDPDEATRLGLISNFQGAPFFFCSPACKQTFDRDPRAAVTRRPLERAMPPVGSEPTPHEGGHGEMPATTEGALPPTEPPPQRLPRKMPAGEREGVSAPLPEGVPPVAPQQQMPGAMPPSETTPLLVDPVCRMEVDPAKARAEGLLTEHKGATWFFCTPACKQEFDADPAVYLPMAK